MFVISSVIEIIVTLKCYSSSTYREILFTLRYYYYSGIAMSMMLAANSCY